MALPPFASASLAPLATRLAARDGKYTDIPGVLAVGDTPGKHGFAILCPQPVTGSTVTITGLERHPHSTQSFLPIRAGRWLVVLAPTLPDGAPDMANVRAFLAGPEDAICIGRNVWHAGLTVLDGPAEFAMMMWRANAGDDGIVHELATPLRLEVS
ncbi:MAG: ureidoglycolate lyase [Devosia sp.]|uniref:ureidoglycolate lyase n=1 Tax=Devosia sp. TaxID=1871048 RepID=UPI001A4E3D08|nr:ureidoglycolate lyase [Devosia sp.]MBL8599755.1 ureidoglycolate lyase [Devosia sp.]